MLFWNPQKPPLPGAIIAESSSPCKKFLARVIVADTEGTYTLKVRDALKDDILAAKTIAAPVGYHSHILSLTWSEDSRIVTVTIDHDFGENNRVFDLHTDSRDA